MTRSKSSIDPTVYSSTVGLVAGDGDQCDRIFSNLFKWSLNDRPIDEPGYVWILIHHASSYSDCEGHTHCCRDNGPEEAAEWFICHYLFLTTAKAAPTKLNFFFRSTHFTHFWVMALNPWRH
ncbi:uncharacterized protein PHALS_15326 [Plasmopara halstedii]|uniref:Uncharacterized protein n=1 Tax=Plasmopara halstedii TaxID=4781 RepID=A0A0P1ADJ9_PLAHL|nr:uncharacterized protein PHALS_15326 [Plasmopara halstedii]CEG38533.1 hypothetical protein PHALS_15326 [Plasmopara halstedii]|eukprot:XP_024574902.1 hypothetical protein PHALS_15326 [Plasmopara halstedii]